MRLRFNHLIRHLPGYQWVNTQRKFVNRFIACGHQANQPIKTFINLYVRAPSQSTKSATFSDLWATMQVSLLLTHLLADCPTKGWMTYGRLIQKETPLTGVTVFASILICLNRLSYWHHLDGLLYYWSTGHNFLMGGNMAELSERWTRDLTSRGLFLESPSNFRAWGPFLESPVHFSGQKSNIQIEI